MWGIRVSAIIGDDDDDDDDPAEEGGGGDPAEEGGGSSEEEEVRLEIPATRRPVLVVRRKSLKYRHTNISGGSLRICLTLW